MPTPPTGTATTPAADVKPDAGAALAKAGHDNAGKAAAGARDGTAKETEHLTDQATATPEERPAPQPTPAPANDAGSLAAAAASGTGTAPQAQAQATTAAASSPRAAPVPIAPEALGLAIARHVADGQKVFEISLAPEELGRVDVRLEFAEDGRVTAHVYADRAETLGLLQRDRAELARSLTGQGLNTDTTSLNFALRDGSSSGGGNTGGDSGTGTGSGGRRGRGRDTSSGDSLGRIEAARRPQAAGSRALDIEV